jgi:head-tail adaptor
MAIRQSPLEPGERDRYVMVQCLTESKGASHAPVSTWEDHAGVWMRKIDVGGRERFAGGQPSAVYDTRWEMGWRDDMDPDSVNVDVEKWRLVYRGRVYDIKYASEIGRKEGIEITTLSGGRAE